MDMKANPKNYEAFLNKDGQTHKNSSYFTSRKETKFGVHRNSYGMSHVFQVSVEKKFLLQI